MTTPSDRVLGGTTEASLPDGAWSVAPSRSEIDFAVKDMWGLRTVRGLFGAYDGRLEVRAGRAAGELTIDADSLNTANNDATDTCAHPPSSMSSNTRGSCSPRRASPRAMVV